MNSFFLANQARLALKMKYSNFSWYKNSRVVASDEGYQIVITSSLLNNQVRKIVAPVFNGFNVKVEIQ